MYHLKDWFKKISKLTRVYIFVFQEIKKASKYLLFAVLLSTLITGCTPVITQYIVKIIIYELENGGKFNRLLTLIGLYIFILFFRNVIMNFKEYINTITGLQLAYNVQNKLIQKMRKLKYETFYSPDFQNSYVTILENSQNESSTLVLSVIFMISLIVQIISTCFVIAHFNFIILFILFLCSIPSIFININTKKEHIKTVEKRSLSYRKISYYFDLLTERNFIKEIRIFDLYKFFLGERESSFFQYLDICKSFSKKELLNKIGSNFLPYLGVFISFLWITIDIINKKYYISDFIFYNGVIFSFQSIVDSIILDISQSYKSIVFINKFFDFLNMNNEIKNGNKKINDNIHHILEFKNVSFKYPYTEKYVLKNINFKIKTGEQLALVGKNGCGKTTLINLVLRIYDPNEGEILLDNIPIKEYSYKEYLKFFSAIFQDYQQYSTSICDYISSGKLKQLKSISKIKQAAISSTAADFIEKSTYQWKSNLTTKFDKDGLELSGGQWQKLAISRAFCSNSKMLIMDEATSSLDPISESEIYENMKNFDKNKICIFISHRMYASKIAKRILYMEDGEINKIGDHYELMKTSNGYRELFESQAVKYI